MPAPDDAPLTQGEAEIAAASEEVIEDAPELTPKELGDRLTAEGPKPTGKVWRYGYLFTMVIFGAVMIWRLDYGDEDDRYDLVNGFVLGLPLWAVGLFLLYVAWWMIRFMAIDIRDGVLAEGRYTSPYGQNKFLYKYLGADGKMHSFHLEHKKETKPPEMLPLWVVKSSVTPASMRTSRYVLTVLGIVLAGGLGGLACYFAVMLMPAPAVATFM